MTLTLPCCSPVKRSIIERNESGDPSASFVPSVGNRTFFIPIQYSIITSIFLSFQYTDTIRYYPKGIPQFRTGNSEYCIGTHDTCRFLRRSEGFSLMLWHKTVYRETVSRAVVLKATFRATSSVCKKWSRKLQAKYNTNMSIYSLILLRTLVHICHARRT